MMKYIVLLLTFIAFTNAAEIKDINEVTGFSFLGVEAEVTASSEM